MIQIRDDPVKGGNPNHGRSCPQSRDGLEAIFTRVQDTFDFHAPGQFTHSRTAPSLSDCLTPRSPISRIPPWSGHQQRANDPGRAILGLQLRDPARRRPARHAHLRNLQRSVRPTTVPPLTATISLRFRLQVNQFEDNIMETGLRTHTSTSTPRNRTPAEPPLPRSRPGHGRRHQVEKAQANQS